MSLRCPLQVTRPSSLLEFVIELATLTTHSVSNVISFSSATISMCPTFIAASFVLKSTFVYIITFIFAMTVN